jgi:triacylglycerol esterase/lipase EstA (alpha/beta hydrolase family)
MLDASQNLSARPDGVVLLHALARRPQSMRKLADALESAGFATFAPAYPSRRATVADCARALAPQVRAFADRVARLHFVGHSMGGLVARALVAQSRPPRLGRVVTLGTPHGGTEIVDLFGRLTPFRAVYGPASEELSTTAAPALNARLGAIDYPLGSLAGTRALNFLAAHFVLPRPNDGTVSVASTRVAGMADHRTVACDHFTLPQRPQAIALCLNFLNEGRF